MKNPITVKNIFLGLLESIVGIFTGLMKGIKYLLMILPVSMIVIIFSFIFLPDQILTAWNYIKGMFIP